MAEPTVTIRIRANTAWNDCSTDASDAITFCGAGSATASLLPVTVPAASNAKIADEMWFYDDSGTDYECTEYEFTTQEGLKTTGTPLTLITNNDYIEFRVVGAESSAGNCTLWDTTGHTTTSNEMLTDSTWSSHCWIIMTETGENATSDRTPTSGSIVAGYKSQEFQATTYEYKGSTTLATFSSACSTTSNYICMHCKIPDDATAGAHTAVLTYEYFYT